MIMIVTYENNDVFAPARMQWVDESGDSDLSCHTLCSYYGLCVTVVGLAGSSHTGDARTMTRIDVVPSPTAHDIRPNKSGESRMVADIKVLQPLFITEIRGDFHRAC